MFSIYDTWPEIAERSFQSEKIEMNFDGIKDIVFAGMGGSGAISDIFTSILSRKPIHTTTVKGYHLPKTVSDKTLVIITSVSGNTVETLKILEQAYKENAKIISFSSGGKLQDICVNKNIKHVKINMENSPRASLTKYLYRMLKVLEDILPIEEQEIKISIEELKKTSQNISSKNFDETNFALDLAKWITKIPIIYYPWGLQAAAIRFKNSLQENSKIHVIAEDILEMSHNGIVPWEIQKDFKPIFVRGKSDFIKTKERWEIIKDFFQSNNIEFKEIITNETGILSKLINLIYIFDYTSIYRAAILGIDPTPVRPIDFIKKQLENKN